MKTTIKTQVRALCSELSPDLYKKAQAKFGRWMRDAYGKIDWEEAEAEMGIDGIVGCLKVYAAESAEGEYSTFNRLTYSHSRKTR